MRIFPSQETEMKEKKVYNLLKALWELNTKPHIAFLVLNLHKDLDFHRGKELVEKGYDSPEVYDTIGLLVAKGDLMRFGKKTKMTSKGMEILDFVDEIIPVVSKMVIS